MSLSCSNAALAWPGECPGKMSEKLTSVFIITAPLTEAAKEEAGQGWF
jgi:hypothetical protein